MHELALCQALIEQLCAVAREHRAAWVARARLRIGPLSGVEPALLEQAFTLARAGTIADEALLEVEQGAVRVRCCECGREQEVPPNDTRCSNCGNWRTQLLSGDELLLVSVELGGAAGRIAASALAEPA